MSDPVILRATFNESGELVDLVLPKKWKCEEVNRALERIRERSFDRTFIGVPFRPEEDANERARKFLETDRRKFLEKPDGSWSDYAGDNPTHDDLDFGRKY